MSTPCLRCSYLFDKKARNLDPRSDLWTRLDLETLQAERQDKSHWQPTLDWTAQSFWLFWFTTFKSEFSMTNFTYAAGKRGNSSICARRTLFPPSDLKMRRLAPLIAHNATTSTTTMRSYAAHTPGGRAQEAAVFKVVLNRGKSVRLRNNPAAS